MSEANLTSNTENLERLKDRGYSDALSEWAAGLARLPTAHDAEQKSALNEIAAIGQEIEAVPLETAKVRGE